MITPLPRYSLNASYLEKKKQQIEVKNYIFTLFIRSCPNTRSEREEKEDDVPKVYVLRKWSGTHKVRKKLQAYS